MEIREMKKFAKDIRLTTMKMLTNLGFGHFGGSLSVVETLAVLYGDVMEIDPKNPKSDKRDYFVLSKGHAGPALYSTLALKGYFPLEKVYSININGTDLPSHPDRLKTPGVDATTGSLGQGISIASGIAMSLKIDKKSNRVFSIVGDGELNEGQCWEAFQFINNFNLNNLVVFLDNNKQQLDGDVEDICKPFSYEEKLGSFGFDVKTVKGDDIKTLHELLKEKRKGEERPLLIILDTIKGQGIPLIENMKNSHHMRLTSELKKEFEKIILEMEKEEVSL